MPLGYALEQRVESLGDTVRLQTWLYDENDQTVTEDPIGKVVFTIQDPAGTKTTGNGVLNEDNSATYVYGPSALEGAYQATATFTLLDGEVRSVPVSFEVIDPFGKNTPAALDVLADSVWWKLQDCFDSELGGPWLRDVTKNYFNREKMTIFVNDALFDINQQNPPTSLDIGTFVNKSTTPPSLTLEGPLLIQGTFLTILRHLIRSYVEQPLPQGAQVVWQERRDYLDRWAAIYKIEMDLYKRWVALWKRQYLGLGNIKSLLANKSGRNLGAPMRSPYSVSRGFF